MKLFKHQKAFTLLELVFVTVILGIVASIGSSVIVQVYESYIMQKAVHNASLKTELAINQLGNRLAYRIQRSLVARVPGQIGFGAGNAFALRDITPATVNLDDYKALEWIAYENDGFSSQRVPGWSGFCDLNASSFGSITTTGSRLSVDAGTAISEQTILANIFGAAPAPAIFFAGTASYATGADYNTSCMYQANGCIFPVTFQTDTNMTFDPNTLRNTHAGNLIYTEFYQLAASAYAVVPENERIIDGTKVWDLFLYSNYQPWAGENYNDVNITKSKLADQVSVFRFKQENGSLRIKICALEQIGLTDTVSICKEKAVIR